MGRANAVSGADPSERVVAHIVESSQSYMNFWHRQV
jgi:hypothetical protein